MEWAFAKLRSHILAINPWSAAASDLKNKMQAIDRYLVYSYTQGNSVAKIKTLYITSGL